MARSPALWDSIAVRYDGLRPDQGLTDPGVRAAWLAVMSRCLPGPGCGILDVGCGTGSLSLLLASAGHAVTGIDFAPAMIDVARSKGANHGVTFLVQDATGPQFAPASFDVVLGRQVLWALPDRASALRNWASLVRPGGSVVLVEGRFASGNGMTAAEIAAIAPPELSPPQVTDLSGDASLWGGPLADQRLLVTFSRS